MATDKIFSWRRLNSRHDDALDLTAQGSLGQGLPAIHTSDNSSPFPNLTGKVSISNLVPEFSGNYSSVHLGNMTGSTVPVAIKVIKAAGKNDPDSVRRRLLREMTIWSKANHTNIYPFYGYVNDPKFGPFGALVSPWCPNGDARIFLDKYGHRMMLAERVKLWQGVVDGVEYLHSCNPPMVHGDLKPGNILVDKNGTPMICDFGLARVFSEQTGGGMTTTSEHTGTARYLSPELVISDTDVPPTPASDIYALGSLGLEFIFLQIPYPNHANNLRGQIFQEIRRGSPPSSTMPQREWPSYRIWPLVLRCWTADPSLRPSALTIGHILRRTSLALPESIIRRIFLISDTICKLYNKNKDYYRDIRNICLLSRTCHRIGTSILYSDVRICEGTGLSKVSSLLYALDASQRRSTTGHHVPQSYGSQTRVMAMSIRLSVHSPDLDAKVLSLIQSMPNLQFLSSRGGDFDLYGDVEIHPMTTLEFAKENVFFSWNQIPKILAITCMQRLYIPNRHLSRPPLEYPPSLGSSSSGVVIPNLLEIKVTNHSCHAQSKEYFYTMSTWILPQVYSLHLGLWEDPKPDIPQFLGAHCQGISHLTLLAYPETISLSEVLMHCDNLRFIRMYSDDICRDIQHLQRPHQNLERLISGSQFYKTGQIESFSAFKASARRLLPKLIDATLRDDKRARIASFQATDDFITVYEKDDGSASFNVDDDHKSNPLDESVC